MKLKDLFEDEERSILSVKGTVDDHHIGAFFASASGLTSLEGSPTAVDGNFYCDRNMLRSLKGGPKFVNGDFYCNQNNIIYLKDAPQSIDGNFICENNLLPSLRDIHKSIKFIEGFANFEFNPIKSHVLGLILIEGLQDVLLDNKEVEDIINGHLKRGRDVFACQEELIEAGYEDFAQL